MAMPELTPITADDLPDFCDFLHRHLDPATSAAGFRQALEQSWGMASPNHGFMIRAQGELVGGIGAIYAERLLNGQPERFCNITSWCVLEAYRAQSMRLAMAVVSQGGFHFTDLTPTEVVAKSLQFLKFKPMDGTRTLIANVPGYNAGVKVVEQDKEIQTVLGAPQRQVYLDHREFPWLRHLAVGGVDGYCHIVFKRKLFKGLPSAEIIALSDARVFMACQGTLRRHFLFRHGMVSMRVESRFLPDSPAFSRQLEGYRPKMYRSDTLEEADMDNLYSEFVALDL